MAPSILQRFRIAKLISWRCGQSGPGIHLDRARRKRHIRTDTALRLARYFGNSPQFWLGLQMDYDLDVAEEVLAERIEREVMPRAVAVV